MSAKTIVCFVMLLISHRIFAQQQPAEDFISERADRKVYHYIGLQANQLIRQLFNFGGNSGVVTNPYLLTYTMNSKANGFGFASGIGYSKIETKTSDVFSTTVSKINDFAIRVGVEKKTYLSKRWMVGLGGDILAEANKAETISNNGGNPNPKVTTKTSRKGFGPRVFINYQFHDRLLVGTEASFYLKWIDQTQTVTGNPSPTDPETDFTSIAFTVPAVVFLIVKL